MYVSAYKTTNLYKMSKDDYTKLLKESITTNYKKTDHSVINSINKEAKGIAEKLKLDDKIECFSDRTSFITLKDHKDNFINNPKTRLVNPAKSEIGMVSKHHLQNINNNLRELLNVRQ